MGVFTSKPDKPKKVVEVTSVDRTILDLKNSRDRLQRYRAKLEVDNERLVGQAKLAQSHGRKETALGLLRLRKFKQEQLHHCEEQLLNVMKLVETIGSQQNDVKLLAAMKAGKDTLKQMHEETTVDDILNLMDSIQEEHEVEREITQIIQQAVPKLSPDAELAVEQELADLEESMYQPLPVAPDTKLPKIGKTTQSQETATAAGTPKPARVAVPG